VTKQTSKTRASKKSRVKEAKSKVGGARAGSGPKPKLGVGVVRSVIKTVRLSTGEHDAQLAAVKRGGAKDWAEWARPILNAAADVRVQVTTGTGLIEVPAVPEVVDLHPDVASGIQTVELDVTAAESDQPCAMDGCRGCGVCQPGSAEDEARRRDALEGPG